MHFLTCMFIFKVKYNLIIYDIMLLSGTKVSGIQCVSSTSISTVWYPQKKKQIANSNMWPLLFIKSINRFAEHHAGL